MKISLRIVLVIIAAVVSYAGVFAAPHLTAATANSAVVPAYGLFELTLDLDTVYSNPFDPAQIDVCADFSSPHGIITHVNGFFFQDYAATKDADGAQLLSEAGKSVWKIRFAPNEPGAWHYVVTATDGTGQIRLKPASFKVTPSHNPGFIRVSRTNPRAFEFDNGQPYFAIGENMCWPFAFWGSPTQNMPLLDRETTSYEPYSYETWMPKMHASKGNWVRIWMSWPGNFGLEWIDPSPHKNRGYPGLGRYSLINAWQLDRTLDIAQQNDIYCMVSFGYTPEVGERNSATGWGLWPDNPYNAAQGGPCATIADFWTNPDARRLYRQRLRYIGARYGWRTNIQSWELWNETFAPTPWLREMAQCLKGSGPFAKQPTDPFKHLVSTTWTDDDGCKIPEMDWTQSHLYGNGAVPDLSFQMAQDAETFSKYGKPHQVSEFGTDVGGRDAKLDPEGKGVNMHNSIWAAAVSGDGGSAMTWWWDNYIEPKNLYHEFAPLAKTMARVPWLKPMWKDAKPARNCVDPVMDTSGPETFSDLVEPARVGFVKAPATDYTIDPITVDSSIDFPTYLYSTGKQYMKTPLRFHVDYPKAGRFIVHVNKVSVISNLRIIVDGKLTAEFPFDASPPKDPSVKPAYKSTTFVEQYHIYGAIFDTDCAVDIAAGKHVIELDNSIGDHMSVTSYTFTNCHSSKYANVRVLGSVCPKYALLWVQNTDHSWFNVYKNNPIRAIDCATALHGLQPGEYDVSYIDTDSGDTVRLEHKRLLARAGLPLTFPKLDTDVAVIIAPAHVYSAPRR